MKKYFVDVLGCPMRAIEAERLSNYFNANGLQKVDDKTDADLIAIFTCSVVDDTENKTIDYIDSLKDLKSEVLLLGCSPAMSPEKFKSFFSGKMISTKDLETEIDQYFTDFKVKFNSINLPTAYQDNYEYGQYYTQLYSTVKKNIFGKTTKIIKPALIITSKGCNNFCSYCTMKLALGPVRSYPLSMIIRNYYDLRKNDTRTFIFNGDDTGSYGVDIKHSLPDIFDACNRIENLIFKKKLYFRKVNWVVDNLHPKWFNQYLDSFIKYSQSGLITNMIIPIQSASDTILKLMRRNYQIEETVKNLKKLKAAAPDVHIQTHAIIGFPTETDDDIQNIAKVFDLKLFDSVIMLRYYETENCSSNRIFPKIDPEIVNERIEKLKDVLNKNKTQFLIDGIIS